MKLKLEMGHREKLKVVRWFGTKYPGGSLYLHEKNALHLKILKIMTSTVREI